MPLHATKLELFAVRRRIITAAHPNAREIRKPRSKRVDEEG